MADSKQTTQKKDPTVTSQQSPTQVEGGQPHPARPINEADDYAGDVKYEDMPDDEKPAPESVVQRELMPHDSGAFSGPDYDPAREGGK
jgi:hypothetical protein